ncbi:ribosome recycling factor [Shuttleworthella satelles]|uniref:ribosome recycling factor n=1 Tax=Shuttleworthella satelles TaxID=177972 RepID=UPI0028D67F94|nr:ribosome recycling factor [Shuttleworthia satelles]
MDSRLNPFEEKMKKSVNALLAEYVSIRAGRANPHILDKIEVEYYGAPTPLQQVANVSVPEARMIQIQPWESSLLKEIEKAINMSDVGIHPTNDGKTIRLVFPELTEDRRKELVKDVKKKGENAKVAIRNIRRDAMDEFKKLKKSEDMSEDAIADLEDQAQKLTDRYVKILDQEIDKKTQELMTL